MRKEGDEVAKNQALRDEMRRGRVFALDVANELGITKGALFGRLGRDLTTEQKKAILTAIDKATERRERERQRIIEESC